MSSYCSGRKSAGRRMVRNVKHRRNFSSIFDRFSVLKASTGLLILAAICLSSGLALAQTAIVDTWQEDQRTNTFPPGAQSQGGSVEDTVFPGSIIGSWRNVYVEAFSGTDASTFRARPGTRDATFNNEDGGTGVIRIFWDGSQRYSQPTGDGNADPDVNDPLLGYVQNGVLTPPDSATQLPGSTDGGSVDPIGLGGIDLTFTCAEGDSDGIHMLFGTTDQGEIDVTVDIFTDGSNWSRATAEQDDGVPRVLSFFFDGDQSEPNVFSPQGGANGTQGASFESVGAIVLSISVSTAAVDVPFSTPITLGCGMDFGDTPVTGQFNPVTGLFEGPSYRVFAAERTRGFSAAGGTFTNERDPETRPLRGPHHSISGPFLGLGSNDTDAEEDGQPSSDATGDDDDGNDDEQGVNLSPLGISDANAQEFQACEGISMDPALGRGNWYCAEVQVSNPTAEWAQAVGWVDFRGSGSFDNLCGTDSGAGSGSSGLVQYGVLSSPANSFCERSSSTLIVGSGGLSDAAGATCSVMVDPGDPLDENGNFTGGNVPPGCEGTVVMTWDLSNVLEELTLNQTFSRFRISTDSFVNADGSGFFTAQGPSPFGYASDGEVEDHVVAEGELPVSIHAFESEWTRQGLQVTWSTVSETENIGFYLWGYDGEELELMTPEMIASTATDAVEPQTYTYVIPEATARGYDNLAVTAVDNRGNEEMYGFFRTDAAFGREHATTPIAWNEIRTQMEDRLARGGYEQSGSSWRQRSSEVPVAADFRVEFEGMQRITHQDLLEAGLDLRGVDPHQIAVTVDGRPVPRNIYRINANSMVGTSTLGGRRNTGERFSNDHAIEFWGEKPSMPDALYVEDYVYRVSVSSADAIAALAPQTRRLEDSTSWHLASKLHAETNQYFMGNVLPNPWVIRRLRANHSTDRYSTTFMLPSRLVSQENGRIEVQVAGANSMPVNPDHHVRVLVNGQAVTEVFFDGRTGKLISADVPAALLQAGENTVEVRLPGGTASTFDLVYLSSIELFYPTQAFADDNRLLVRAPNGDQNLVAGGFTESGGIAYAWNGETLRRLNTEVAGRGMLQTEPPAGDISVWLSTASGLHRPAPIGTVGANPFEQASGDLVMIVHPAFLPSGPFENHPLNDFIAQRQGEGWSVMLADITDIQAHYGGGMALPQAVNRFLQDADTRFSYEHVLLVGDDSYDYLDRLGLGSVSFIPTLYAPTSRITHTPSDALLADLSGNGVADKAIGRWPVRSLDDLSSIVTKTLDWGGSMADLQNAVWVSDTDEPGQLSFTQQANRMVGSLADAGWPDSQLDTIFIDDIGDPHLARNQLFDLLEQGRAFTGFVGHGAPSAWTFQGLLMPNDLAELRNEGLPTLIGTSTCYTSYFVSPFSETVAHRWMNGYRLDANDQPVPGAANGAVAIHGAATLSNYSQNEFVVRRVQDYLLQEMTLGQAVLKARQDAADRGLVDQVINWSLLGDPTIRASAGNLGSDDGREVRGR